MTIALLADADAMMADNSPHHGHDTGSPGSETSQQETFPAQFLNVEDWAAHMLLDAPHQQLPLPPHHSVHPHPPSHQVPEHLNSPQEGLHAEESSTHALHPPPVQPDNFSTPASLSGNANPHKAPGIRDADCQHQELMQTPDAALDDGRDDDWYDMLQPLQDSDSESSHYSIGDDSPLSRLADSGCDHDMALDAALSSAATPPAHQDYSRKQALNAVEKVPEADVAPQHNSRYAEPAKEQVPPSPAVTYRQYVVTTMNRIVNGHKSRKRPMTTEEQVPEAVPPHNSRHVMTRPAASPTAVNQSHAVLPHPRQLQQHSIAGHFRTGVQHCEREPVQQAQADALSVARGEEPRRKRRKTAGIPFSAARITLPTALSTAAATQAASAHFPLPDEVSAAAASTAASTAAFTAAVAIQASVPAMTCAAEMHYQQGDVVWAKLGSDPYWPARVSLVSCIWLTA